MADDKLRQSSLDLDLDNLDVSSSDDDESYRGRSAYFRSFPHVPHGASQRPLIDYVKNEWKSVRGESSSTSSSSPERDTPRCVRMLLSILTAPRVRRYIIVFVVLLGAFGLAWQGYIKPSLEEHAILLQSLDINSLEKVGGWFGTNARPEFADIVQMRHLDPSLLPGDTKLDRNDRDRRRLIIVGDVHGCRDELQELLKKVNFDRTAGDHLILTGDIIHKGPYSTEVVDLAREQHASCVRGNHEDRILLLRQQMKAANTLDQPEKDASQNDASQRTVARQLTDEQAAWLTECPVILKLGPIRGMGDVIVVHGGLVPGVDLDRQDPWSVMNMRSIDTDTHVPSPGRDGVAWTKLFNQYQTLLVAQLKKREKQKKKTETSEDNERTQPHPTTVIYGHDAGTSLNIQRYTKGLDSGCVYGRKLTAFIIEDGGSHKVVQVKCKEYRKA